MKNQRIWTFFVTLIICLLIYALKLFKVHHQLAWYPKSLLPDWLIKCSVAPLKTPLSSLQGIKDTFYQDVQHNVSMYIHVHLHSLHVVNPWHLSLCDDASLHSGVMDAWSYCLPISGRTDVPYCAKPNRNDQLRRHTPNTLCYGSVIHMILVDVYNTMEELEQDPAILHGSLLGAIRNKSIIPYTQNADIGYAVPLGGEFHSQKLANALRNKGYHMFNECKGCMWRICVGARHPLAYNLYNEDIPLYQRYKIPYTDLYAMKELGDTSWVLEGTGFGGVVTSKEFKPYIKVKLNDAEMNTLANPIKFLERQYGMDWRLENP